MNRVLGGLALALVVFLFACGKPPGTRVEPIDGRQPPATLSLLQGIPGAVFFPTPLVPQSLGHSCGSAALQSLLAYYGDSFREGQLQRLLGTDPENGTSFRPMQTLVERVLNVEGGREAARQYPACEEDTKKSVGGYLKECVEREAAVLVNPKFQLAGAPLVPAAERYRLDVYPGTDATNGLSVAQLDANVSAGRPVLILLQAWPDDPKPGWEAEWESGHFVVVVGHDAKNYYLLDPSTTGSWAYLPRADLVRRWHDIDAVRINGKVENLRVTHFAFILSRPRAFVFNGAVPRME